MKWVSARGQRANKEAAAAIFLRLLWTVVSEPPAIVTVAYQDNSAEQKQKHHRMFVIRDYNIDFVRQMTKRL